MRETLRDFMIGVSAAGALFASFQSWNTGRVLSAEIADLREGVAELRGTLQTTSDTVITHVNTPGMHGAPSFSSLAEPPPAIRATTGDWTGRPSASWRPSAGCSGDRSPPSARNWTLSTHG